MRVRLPIFRAMVWGIVTCGGPLAAVAGQAPRGGTCDRLVQQQLRDWGAVGPPRTQPNVAGRGLVRHWPTAQLGVWVVEADEGSATTLTRVEPQHLTRISWTDGCTARADTRARGVAPAPRFSDDDLVSLLRRSSRGVLYLWSPHMPLSVDAYDALVSAARSRGLEVMALLDPAADRVFARASIEGRALPEAALRVADSIELTFRDALVHAPAIQAYANGQLQGSPFPGAHTADEYGAFLDRVLGMSRP